MLDVQDGEYALNANIGGVDKPIAVITRIEVLRKYQIEPCLTATTVTVTDSYYWHVVDNEPAVSDVEYDFESPISFETYFNEHYMAPDGWSFEFLGGCEINNPTIVDTL